MDESNPGDLLPPKIAEAVEALGVKKASQATGPMFLLALLGGAFIALGGNFSTIILVGAQGLPWGLAKTLSGVAFSLGLILVMIAGAELFTGNTLLVMALASRRVPLRSLLRNWTVVYTGNFIGSLATAVFILLSRQYAFDGGEVGALAVKLAEHKCSLDFVPAFFLGIACNVLVCLAIWTSLGARTLSGKILAIVFPVTAFVAGGFEHCVANMYLIPLGLLIKETAAGGASGPLTAVLAAAPHLTWDRFLFANLLPVTVGNIVGGAGLVGVVYWLIYGTRQRPAARAAADPSRLSEWDARTWRPETAGQSAKVD